MKPIRANTSLASLRILVAILVFSVGSAGCTKSQEPLRKATNIANPIDNAVIESLSYPLYQEELTRFAGHSPENAFLPRGLLPPLTPEQHRIKTIEFYRYYDLRTKYFSGMASEEERQEYFEKRLSRLNQKESLIRALETSQHELTPKKALKKTVARPTTIGQRYILNAELAQTRLSIQDYSARLATPGPIIPIPPIRERVMCAVDYWGFVYCAKESRLMQWMVAGHWNLRGEWVIDRQNFEIANLVLEELDKLMDRLEDYPSKNTLLICPPDMAVPINTNGLDPLLASVAPSGNYGLPSMSEMAGMSEACESISSDLPTPGSTAGSGGGLGGNDSSWSDNTINSIESMLDRCQSGPGGMISYGFDSILPWINPLTQSTLLWHVLNLSDDTGYDAQEQRRQQTEANNAYRASTYLHDASDYEDLADQLAATAASLEQDAAQLESQAGQLRQAAIRATQDDNDPQKAEELWQEAAKKDAEAAKKRQEAEKTRQEEEAARQKADEAKRKAECLKAVGREACSQADLDAANESAQQTAGSQVDADLSTCEDMRADWNRFKAECNRSDGWDRPGTDCNALLRRANGCVDITLINPGPEGDKTCQRATIDQQTLIREACEERGKVMSALEPGQSACGLLERGGLIELADICRNPKARPMEDQCPGDGSIGAIGPEPIFGGNPPKPYADILNWGDVQLYDGLQLDGLGLPFDEPDDPR